MRIVVDDSPGEVRIALLDAAGVLREAWVERPARPDGVGDVQRARVSALAPMMSGAFVALADGETGFLPETEAGAGRQPIARAVSEGQVLLVRVTRAAQGGKGPRVTTRLTEAEAALAEAAEAAGTDAPRRLARGPSAAVRLARLHPAAPVAVDGAAGLARLRAVIGPDRVTRAPGGFDDALEAAFDALAGPEAALPGGGRLLIHPTPALTAIDIDGAARAGGRDAGDGARLNRDAMTEVARQVRLRNLAGPILIDPAGLGRAGRDALVPALAEALAEDRLARLHGVGPIGLLELVRARVHPPLHEVLGWPPSPLTRGLAALRAAVREAAAVPGRRWALRASPAVLAALRDLPGALDEAAAAIGTALALRPDPQAAATIEPDDGRG